MSKRHLHGRLCLTDWHLWAEVKRTVVPLRAQPDEQLVDEPLPIPADRPPPVFVKGAKWNGPALPAYRPERTPLRPTEPGRVIEPRLRRRLSRGQIEIDATIDLHGMRQAEARAALQRFVAARAARGDRTILVITGKGLRSSGDLHLRERGVLRAMLPLWLREPELAPYIAGWDVSAPGHGGDGAWYIRLRRLPR